MSIKVKETVCRAYADGEINDYEGKIMAVSLNDLVDFKELKDKTKNKDIIFIGDHTPNFKKLSSKYLKKLNLIQK